MSNPTGNASIQTLVRMNAHLFFEAEKKMADFLLGSQWSELVSLPVAAAAVRIGVSEATIIRFCKKIGLSGYTELKLRLAHEQGQQTHSSEIVEVPIDRSVSPEDLPERIIRNTISGLRDTLGVVHADMLQKAIAAIQNAPRIALFGVANSAVVCQDLYCKLLRLGMPCTVYDDSHQQLTAAVHLRSGDVAIGVSHSGQTLDTVRALQLAKESGATTICLTNHVHSPLTEAADIHLLTGGNETSFTSETMVSRICQLAIVDMLYVGLILSDYETSLARLEQVNVLMKDKAF